MTMKILLTGSAIALGAALSFSTPAQAQQACDLNGVVQPAPASTDTLRCGTDSSTGFDGAFSTLVGLEVFSSGTSLTVVGANIVAQTGTGTILTADTFLVRPTTMGSTVIGAFAATTGVGNVAVGDQSTVGVFDFTAGFSLIDNVDFGTAIGSGASVTGDGGTAIGYSADATAAGAIAIGENTTSGFADAIVIGDSTNSVGGANAVAIGNNADANGADSVAIGTNATASANAVSIGNGNVATGEGAVALGDNNSAVGLGAVALGNNSIASSAGAVAIGNAALANGTSGVAIGNGASNAAFANSVALGNGTINTAANQVSVGGRTIGGVANGVAATDAVNLGQLNAATAGIATSIAAINSSILGLQGDVTTLYNQNRRQDRNINKANEGVAMALAMESPNVPAGSSFALSGGIGGFQGRNALATAISAAIGEKATVSAGLGYGLNTGEIGYRAGFQVAF